MITSFRYTEFEVCVWKYTNGHVMNINDICPPIRNGFWLEIIELTAYKQKYI